MRASEQPALSEGQDLREVRTDEASDEGKPEWWTSDDWATPIDVFNRISERYGPFDLDACCRDATAKATRYFTKDDDGLAHPWRGRVWVNPPYSDPAPWIQKAILEVEQGHSERVVMLLPASIDTGWYHSFVLPYADVVPVRGRIRFIGWKGTPIGSPKAGSVIAIFPKRAMETFDALPKAKAQPLFPKTESAREDLVKRAE